MSALLEAALAYEALGWSVIPLHAPAARGCSCSKGAACGKNAGKHPRLEWAPFQRRRAISEEITTWWRRWPAANVGIVCGAISQLAVFDVDPRNGGDDTLHELDARGYWLPEASGLVATGGGGLHYYLALDRTLPKCAPLVGIELQAGGGYVVAPPSRHASGRTYEWIRVPVAPLPPVPDWLLKVARYVIDDTPATSAPPGPSTPDTPAEILAAVESAGLYLRPHRRTRGWHYVRCPWAADHSNGEMEALLIEPGSVMAGARPGGWGYVCKHSHCAVRSLGDLLDYLKLPRRRR